MGQVIAPFWLLASNWASLLGRAYGHDGCQKWKYPTQYSTLKAGEQFRELIGTLKYGQGKGIIFSFQIPIHESLDKPSCVDQSCHVKIPRQKKIRTQQAKLHGTRLVMMLKRKGPKNLSDISCNRPTIANSWWEQAKWQLPFFRRYNEQLCGPFQRGHLRLQGRVKTFKRSQNVHFPSWCWI